MDIQIRNLGVCSSLYGYCHSPIRLQDLYPCLQAQNATSGSGSGFESGWQNTDYCGNTLDVSLNEHSVQRIPVYIWVFVIGIVSLIAVSRCAIAINF